MVGRRRSLKQRSAEKELKNKWNFLFGSDCSCCSMPDSLDYAKGWWRNGPAYFFKVFSDYLGHLADDDPYGIFFGLNSKDYVEECSS